MKTPGIKTNFAISYADSTSTITGNPDFSRIRALPQ